MEIRSKIYFNRIIEKQSLKSKLEKMIKMYGFLEVDSTQVELTFRWVCYCDSTEPSRTTFIFNLSLLI
jgi:hypothetical protein